MLFTKEQLSFLNTAIQARYDTTQNAFVARAISEAERVNFAEIYKKLSVHVFDGKFSDAEVEFFPQELEYIEKVMKDAYPAAETLIVLQIKELFKK